MKILLSTILDCRLKVPLTTSIGFGREIITAGIMPASTPSTRITAKMKPRSCGCENMVRAFMEVERTDPVKGSRAAAAISAKMPAAALIVRLSKMRFLMISLRPAPKSLLVAISLLLDTDKATVRLI